MYGEAGTRLVQHAKRTLGLPNLPPYQTELVRQVTREARELDRDVTAMLESFQGAFDPAQDPATACSLLVNHLSMRRNKRCLLAYHRVRTQRLEQMSWDGEDVMERTTTTAGSSSGSGGGGGGSSHQQQHQPTAPGQSRHPHHHQQPATSQGDPGGSSALSPEEEDYVRQFGDLLAAYKGQWTDIDLTGSLEPPKDLFIDVRVLKDAGEIQTEYGSITLTKNSQFYVRQGDVDRLIAQGYLQRLG